MAKRFEANSIRNFYLLFPKKHDKEAKKKKNKKRTTSQGKSESQTKAH